MSELSFVQVLAPLMFISVDDAAVDALSRVQDITHEVGGKCYADSRQWYTCDAPAGDGNSRKMVLSGKTPEGLEYVAMYHTHPGNYDLFSPQDVRVSDKRGVLSYIRTMFNGNIRRYEPGVSSTYLLTQSGTKIPIGRVSAGTLIAKVRG